MPIFTNRKCIATGEILPKEKLIRIVKMKDGQIFVDSDKKGRGAYVKRDPKLFDKVKKQRLLHRAFRNNVNASIYDDLEQKIKEA